MSLPEELIPELLDWNNGNKIDALSWIIEIGSYKEAIAYSSIFLPEFCEYDGCIFLGKNVNSENYKAWLEECKGDKSQVEMVMNHKDFCDYFPNDQTATSEQIIFFANLLKNIWESNLKISYPDYDFVVDLNNSCLENGDITESLITFYIKRGIED